MSSFLQHFEGHNSLKKQTKIHAVISKQSQQCMILNLPAVPYFQPKLFWCYDKWIIWYTCQLLLYLPFSSMWIYLHLHFLNSDRVCSKNKLLVNWNKNEYNLLSSSWEKLWNGLEMALKWSWLHVKQPQVIFLASCKIYLMLTSYFQSGPVLTILEHIKIQTKPRLKIIYRYPICRLHKDTNPTYLRFCPNLVHGKNKTKRPKHAFSSNSTEV